MYSNNFQVDSYSWGSEKILWGNDLKHGYTYKLLMPNVGKEGCLSLQSHKTKNETWLVTKGSAWSLIVKDWKIETAVLSEGDVVNIEPGTIHRLMGITPGCIIAEASTPDLHAANKYMPKDVIRYHCVFGRPCVSPNNEFEKQLIDVSVRMTEEAIAELEEGRVPVPDSYQLVHY